jgi:hypothetical protein
MKAPTNKITPQRNRQKQRRLVLLLQNVSIALKGRKGAFLMFEKVFHLPACLAVDGKRSESVCKPIGFTV